MRRQPLLVVLRPGAPLEAVATLVRLQALGIRHVEIAWQPGPHWAPQMAELVGRFPALDLGAASVCDPVGVAAAAAAGCRYVVSPVLDPSVLRAASERELVLVPGVMTPSEVHSARRQGCRLVKLFPAVSVGIDHWRRLRQPLGEPLPFCIAAGGLKPVDVHPWLAAGVDAVALGSGLFTGPADSHPLEAVSAEAAPESEGTAPVSKGVVELAEAARLAQLHTLLTTLNDSPYSKREGQRDCQP